MRLQSDLPWTFLEVLPCNWLFKHWELQAPLALARDTPPGQDSIITKFLNICQSGLKCLLEMVNFVWQYSEVPADWEEAVIVPVPKLRKGSTLPENYRYISLTGCLCKAMERMVNWHIVLFLERQHFLSHPVWFPCWEVLSGPPGSIVDCSAESLSPVATRSSHRLWAVDDLWYHLALWHFEDPSWMRAWGQLPVLGASEGSVATCQIADWLIMVPSPNSIHSSVPFWTSVLM